MQIADSWKIAAFRAVLTATVLGVLGALSIWSQTNELKLIAIAGLTPFFSTLALRLGAEGYVDSRKP